VASAILRNTAGQTERGLRHRQRRPCLTVPYPFAHCTLNPEAASAGKRRTRCKCAPEASCDQFAAGFLEMIVRMIPPSCGPHEIVMVNRTQSLTQDDSVVGAAPQLSRFSVQVAADPRSHVEMHRRAPGEVIRRPLRQPGMSRRSGFTKLSQAPCMTVASD
jgi:hypothetical protein